MANITARQVLDMVDALLPNQYTDKEKLRWLAQAEAIVRREIMHETQPFDALSDNTELTVIPPYDELYRYYLESQIHYANGEAVRFNNAAASWNNSLAAYRDYRCRTTPPDAGGAIKFC